jgi:hypothetical protein
VTRAVRRVELFEYPWIATTSIVCELIGVEQLGQPEVE